MGAYEDREDMGTYEESRAERRAAYDPDYYTAEGLPKHSYDILIKMDSDETEHKAPIAVSKGTKFDSGKPRFGLLSPYVEEAIAQVLTDGAAKYADRNWELGLDYERVYSATRRHLSAFWKGEDIDPDSGRLHLAHAMTELMFLLHYELNKAEYKEFDNRPRRL